MSEEPIKVYGFGTQAKDKDLIPVVFNRKKVDTGEVAFKVTHCGVCHSDLHQVRNDWSNTQYPCVPGHEVVGTVTAIGEGVSKVKVGDVVGVGCIIDSCQECNYCEASEENYCQGEKGATLTYNGPMKPDGTNTYGGYSTDLIAREEFILKIPKKIDPEYAGPIMCAGITVYSPMKHWDLKEGQTLGIAGIGGLGHMAVQIGKALGAKVVAFTRDGSKEDEILKMGADKVIVSTDDDQMKAAAGSLGGRRKSAAGLGAYLRCFRQCVAMAWGKCPPAMVPQAGDLLSFAAALRRHGGASGTGGSPHTSAEE